MAIFNELLVGFDLCGAHDARPALEVGRDHARQVFRGAWKGIEPLLEQVIGIFYR